MEPKLGARLRQEPSQTATWRRGFVALAVLATMNTTRPTYAELWAQLPGPPKPGPGSVKIVTGPSNDPNTLYAALGAASGGLYPIYKTSDGANTWTQIGFAAGESAGGSLVVAPSDSHIIYASNGLGVVYKSTDGGQNFQQTHPYPQQTQPYGILTIGAVDPTDPDIAYAFSSSYVNDALFRVKGLFPCGLSRTTDGGTTWQDLTNEFAGQCLTGARDAPIVNEFGAVVFDPSTPTTLYALRRPNALYKSTDGGASWTLISSGSEIGGGTALIVDPSNPNRLYEVVPGSGGGVYRSTDQGVTWALALGTTFDTAGGFSSVALDPNDPNTVYASQTENGVLWKSTDAGMTWTASLSPQGSTGGGVPFLWLYLAPTNPTTVYYGGSGNLAIAKSTDGGVTWSDASSGITGGPTGLTIDPTNGANLYALNNTQLYRSSDHGATWAQIDTSFVSGVSGSRITDLAIAPSNGNIIYLAGSDHLYRSTDAGASWSAADAGLQYPPLSIVIDPVDANTVYLGARYKTTDGGASWNQVPAPPYTIYSVAITSPPTAVYIGTDFGVYESTDGGTTWNQVLAYNGSAFWAIAVDPTTNSTVFAMDTGHLSKSTDGGASWTKQLTSSLLGLPASITIDSTHPGTVYVNGLRTTDGGNTWRQFTAGLPFGWFDVVVDPTDGSNVYAGTLTGAYALLCATTSPACDDGDPCTQDCFNPITNSCVHSTALSGSCRTATKSQLEIKYSIADTSKSSMSFKWSGGEATALSDLADPTASAQYSFCVYSGSADLVALRASVAPGGQCAGQPCWKPVSSKGFKYTDKTGSQDGITAISLAAGVDGKAKILLKAEGSALPNPLLPLPLPVGAALFNDQTGACFVASGRVGAQLNTLDDDVLSDTDVLFKAKAGK